MKLKFIMLGVILISLIGCKNEIKIKDIELTSKENEAKKDSIIISEINKFLKNNKSDVVMNYHFLCDSSMIKPLRSFNVKHKRENIKIQIGKKNIRISPIPGSYKISDGPIAEYIIENDSLGKFDSYLIDIVLTDNFKISDFKGTIRFKKELNGIIRLSFIKEIRSTENYLIKNKLNKNWW